jgi:hypothetical protein
VERAQQAEGLETERHSYSCGAGKAGRTNLQGATPGDSGASLSGKLLGGRGLKGKEAAEQRTVKKMMQ